jgi:cytochrome oxidase Cu insertion factor (SCO1/SenC/PrrC family)
VTRPLAAILAALALVVGAASFSCDGATEAAGYPTSLAVAADHPWSGPELADFALVRSDGNAVTRADLTGRPCVLDFVFSTCAGPCPAMSASMRILHDELDASVRLVSISVDPERDTPEVLAEYATSLGADAERWWFLTGEVDQLRALAQSVSLAVDPVPAAEAQLGFQVTHSTKFVVLDGEGRVRGYYDGTSEEGRAAAAARARFLAR